MKRALSHIFCLTLAGVLLAALPWAQDLDGSAASSTGHSDRRADLQREVEQARADLEAQRASDAAELGALRAERARLAQTLLEYAQKAARARLELAGAEDEGARAQSALELDVRALGNVQAAFASALERLAITSREVPGTERIQAAAQRDAQRLADMRDGLGSYGALLDADEGAGQGSFDPGADLLRGTLTALADALADSQRAAVEKTELFTADGHKRTVDLLRAGWVACAYSDAEGRAGIALSSPLDAGGLRWSEALDAKDALLVQAAIDAAQAGRAVTLPIDASGQLRPEALETRETFATRLRSGGPLMIPLLVVAAAALLLSVERFVVLFAGNRRAHRFARKVLARVGADDLQAAAQACASASGILARTMGACLANASKGQAAMEDAIQTQLLHEVPLVSRFLRTLAILASVAPLLGLLGTVTGIIQTFGVIKTLGTTDPSLMAGGISVALVTTAAGLAVAIPTLLAQGILRGRGDRLIADAERYAASLLLLLAHPEGPQ